MKHNIFNGDVKVVTNVSSLESPNESKVFLTTPKRVFQSIEIISKIIFIVKTMLL